MNSSLYTNWVKRCTSILLFAAMSSCTHKLSSGPESPTLARELIEQIMPKTWRIADASPTLADMTKEYFPDARVQTLLLVGPQVDHTRWTDHNGVTHVEDWNKECLLLWITPGDFKPKFPSLLDGVASGEKLPSCIFTSKRVCVYGYVSNYGSGAERMHDVAKDATLISIDAVEPSWRKWDKAIEERLGKPAVAQ